MSEFTLTFKPGEDVIAQMSKEFVCPKCGGHHWSTNPTHCKKGSKGYCKRSGCSFTFPRGDTEHVYFRMKITVTVTEDE